MACHEIAGLRLGLMNVLGISDEKEKQHELSELGRESTNSGPICQMTKSANLKELKQFFESSLTRLAEKVSKLPSDDPKLGYYRSLMIATKKVELELARLTDDFRRFYQDLEEVHDYIHEVFPA
ncbi:MAG: DUF3209 family protein [Candidatus Omnitrophica bacterium]|nr:DUF3209 family protein [Candidatus Omnitrophota bacterium]